MNMSNQIDETNTTTKRNIYWITRNIAEELDRRTVLKSSLREIIIYIFFLIFFTISAIGQKDSYRYYLTHALEEQFIQRPFKTTNDFEINFEAIRTVADFFYYCESLLLDSLYWDFYYDEFGNKVESVADDDRKVLYENKILGVARIRQNRVKNDSCTIHPYFIQYFRGCYAKFSQTSVDTTSFGVGSKTAWVYSDSSTTKSLSFTGQVSTYEGGGFFTDLKTTRNETANIIKDLKDNLWITRHSRAVFIDFSLYNANLNMFAVCKLIFEMPPSGGVLPSHKFHTLYFLKRPTMVFIAKVCFAIMIVFFILEVIRDIVFFKLKYFKKFWSYIEISIIIFSISSVVTTIIIQAELPEILKTIENNPTKYGNLEKVTNLQLNHRYINAIALFFAYVKIFKYISFSKTMNQLNDTLTKCAKDVFGFSLMFFIVFFAYAQLGFILFGSQVKGFSTFNMSMFTLLKTILGDFDYYEIEKANRKFAPIYFLSYIFIVFFVLINMFLAIINDTYSDVKSEIALAPEVMQMSDYVKELFQKCFRRHSKTEEDKQHKYNELLQKIHDTLKKCGFSDLEIAMFFNRYNINPRAKINQQHMEKLEKDLNEAYLQMEIKQFSQTEPAEGYVHINDFLTQQTRLEQIESQIDALSKNIRKLIVKMDKLNAK